MITKKIINQYRGVNPTFKTVGSILLRFLLILVMVTAIGNALNAQSLRLNKTVTNTSPAPGEPFNFTLDIACQSTTTDCEDVYISDFIPASLQFLNFSNPLPSGVSAASYDPITNEAVINFDNDLINAGTSIQITIQVRFPFGTFDGTMADNTAFAFSSNGGDISSSASATSSGGTMGGSGCDAIPNDVTADFETLSPGEVNQSAEVGNTGSDDIDNWVYETSLDDVLTLNQIRTPQFPGVNHLGQLFYQSSDNIGTWQLWTNFNLDSRIVRNVAGLNLPPGVKVTDLRLELGTVLGNGLYNPFIYPDGFRRRFVYTSLVEGGLASGTEILNCGGYSGSIEGEVCASNACDNTRISEGADIINSSKSITDLNNIESSPYSVGETVLVHLQFASPAQQSNDIVGAVLTDVLPFGLTYVPNSWYIEFGSNNIDNQDPVIETGTLVDGRDFVRFIWDDSHNNEFTIEPTGGFSGFSVAFEATIDGGITQGFHRNNLYASPTGSTHSDCDDPDIENFNNGYADSYCNKTYDFEVIFPPGSAGLESKKEVKGSLNSNYNSFPNFGTTIPGGINDYRLTIENPNPTPVDNIVIIDIFPFIGDTEVLNPSAPRFSEWRPNLLAPIPIPSGGTVYYTTVTNPCRDEVAGPSDPSPFPTGCTNPGWTTTPPADITTVTGFKIDLGGRRLNQGQEFVFEWEMRVPVDAPTNGEIAWNSFAWAGSNATTGAPLIPAEPIKVGIESFAGSVPFHGDFVWHDVNGNGVQDLGEPGVDGVTITLYEDNGDGIANPNNDTPYMTTISANGGQYLFSDFPLGNYFIEFSNLPIGFNPTHTDVGGNDAIDSDGIITNVMTFTSTTDDRTCDLGLFEGEPPSICTCTNCPDKDGDGVADIFDKDSDNDGILNVDEGFECTTIDLADFSIGDPLTNFNSANVTIGGSQMQIVTPLTFGGGATLDEYLIDNRHNGVDFGLLLGVDNSTSPNDYLGTTYTFSDPVCGFNGTILDIDRSDNIIIYGRLNGNLMPFNIARLGDHLAYDGSNRIYSTENINSEPPNFDDVVSHSFDFTFQGCINEIEIRIYDSECCGGSYTLLVSTDPTCSGPDCDNDGVPNYLDLDSDNDGIPDAIECSGDLTLNLVDCMLVDNGNTQNDIDGDGCADGIVRACTPQDLDNDGIFNFCDLDSDGDGCSDAEEGETNENPNVNDSEVSNNYNSPAASVNECGLVLWNGNTECHTPADNDWLNASIDTKCCPEVCPTIYSNGFTRTNRTFIPPISADIQSSDNEEGK